VQITPASLQAVSVFKKIMVEKGDRATPKTFGPKARCSRLVTQLVQCPGALRCRGTRCIIGSDAMQDRVAENM
jgi:hypothetical protein